MSNYLVIWILSRVLGIELTFGFCHLSFTKIFMPEIPKTHNSQEVEKVDRSF